MVRAHDLVLRGLDIRWRCTRLELSRRAEQRKIELRHLDAIHRLAARRGPGGIGVGQRMAQMAAGRIGMSLDDDDRFCHG
jgi:hypothetical protein